MDANPRLGFAPTIPTRNFPFVVMDAPDFRLVLALDELDHDPLRSANEGQPQAGISG
jgi:hypothetical protein